MAKDLVFEIGTEEIPAAEVSSGLIQLQEKAEKELAKLGLAYKEITVVGSPRRMALLVKGLEEQQAASFEETRGPAKQVAYDDKGKPTKAAEGFAGSQGIEVRNLQLKKTEQGEYVFAVKEIVPKQTIDLLPQLCKDLTLSLSFKKSMRWGDRDLRFSRPIRWLLGVFGEQSFKVVLDGIPSGNKTYGHRAYTGKALTVKKAPDYTALLAKNGVIVDQRKREAEIANEIQKAAKAAKGLATINPNVLEEVIYLVESPHAVAGHFSEEFLRLPRAVIVTAMESHQRYFPVEDKEGTLLPSFIVVHNGKPEYDKTIREGHERVIRARLADALFFFEEDRTVRLVDKVDVLKDVVFQEKLGTVFEKTERLVKIIEYLGREVGAGDEVVAAAARAALLAKADLTTNMVREFPTLQGTMGTEYALLDGEKEMVAVAIGEHYQPRSFDDIPPATTAGTLLSMADKIDTVAGIFAVGLIPSGSEDPYALRRQAQGVVLMIIREKMRLPLMPALSFALDLYHQGGYDVRPADEVLEDLKGFFLSRVKYQLRESGVRYDVADAVLSDGMEDLVMIDTKAKRLMERLGTDVMEDVLTGFERCYNLSQGAGLDKVDSALFDDPAEGELYDAVLAARKDMDAALEKGDMDVELEVLAGLRPFIDVFFDKVLVMDKVDAKRWNRLALLLKAVNVFMSVADFSKIVREGG